MPRVSRHYLIEVGEPILRELVDMFGEEVLESLYEAIVEEFEDTVRMAHDHTPSEELRYVQYKEDYDGFYVISANESGRFWCTMTEYVRHSTHVNILYSSVPFSCREEYFEVDSA